MVFSTKEILQLYTQVIVFKQLKLYSYSYIAICTVAIQKDQILQLNFALSEQVKFILGQNFH